VLIVCAISGLALSRIGGRRWVRTFTSIPPSKDHLTTLRGLIESGEVAPIIDRVYHLSAVPDAIRYVEVEHARAKVVISVAA
jgi:NADPH:quinone reductase-like Zn-dependent oxidoreductase